VLLFRCHNASVFALKLKSSHTVTKENEIVPWLAAEGALAYSPFLLWYQGDILNLV
jgi:hypothetical protein